MKQIIQCTATLFLSALSQMTAYAHPGHGNGQSGPAHYITEPQHGVVIVAALVSVVMVAVTLRAIAQPIKRGN